MKHAGNSEVMEKENTKMEDSQCIRGKLWDKVRAKVTLESQS